MYKVQNKIDSFFNHINELIDPDLYGSGYSDWISNLNALQSGRGYVVGVPAPQYYIGDVPPPKEDLEGSGNIFSGNIFRNRVQPVTINIRPYRTILDNYGGYRIHNILLYKSALGRYYIQLFIRNLRGRLRPVYIRLEKSGQTGITVSESISQSDDHNVLSIDNSNDFTVEEFIHNVGDTSSLNSYTYIVNLLSNNGYFRDREKRFMDYNNYRRPQYSAMIEPLGEGYSNLNDISGSGFWSNLFDFVEM